jgi:hypothetical protein
MHVPEVLSFEAKKPSGNRMFDIPGDTQIFAVS